MAGVPRGSSHEGDSKVGLGDRKHETSSWGKGFIFPYLKRNTC